MTEKYFFLKLSLGNQKFVSGEDIEAIESYTMSLAYADSPELKAYAYANRSAALYRKQFYKECLMDIDAAVSSGYPEEKKKKLQERGERAMAELVKFSTEENEAQENCPFKNNEENNDDVSKKFPLIKSVETNTEIKDRDSTKSEMENIRNSSASSVPQNILNDLAKPKYLEADGPPQLAYGPSKEAPSTSDGVQIAFSEKFGRHLIATKEFRPGDVLAVEEPFVSVIYQER